MSIMHAPLRLPVIAATGLVALCAVVYGARDAAPAAATSPGANGAIAFAKEVGGDFELFSVQSDGTGERRLTRVDGDAVHPDWSPDGTRIVFEFDHKHAKPRPYCSIALMNADGTGLTDLAVQRRGCDNQPSFSPDGRRIVFVHYDDVKDVEKIATMDLAGADRHDLPSPWKNGVTDPNMSPDGSTITFVRGKEPEKLQALFAMRADGSGLRRLTPYGWEVAIKHDWSPDGTLIALTTNADFVRPRSSANIVTIRPDGSGAKRLTRFRGGSKNAFAGSFSPDGTQIVFRLERGDAGGLAVIDRDGRNLRPLTTPRADKPRFIDWGSG
jgi:Tol biopolymer transport system component